MKVSDEVLVTVSVNSKKFTMTWEQSTKHQTHVDLKQFLLRELDESFITDDAGFVVSYPLVRIRPLGLTQERVIGIAMGCDLWKGDVSPAGEWSMLWHCPPNHDEVMRFVDMLRRAARSSASVPPEPRTYCLDSDRYLDLEGAEA